MPKSTPRQPDDGSPTASEIFRVFRNTTLASIEGLKLLLDECAGLRADLVTVHSLHGDGDGDGVFSARQRIRIFELQEAAKEMADLQASLPGNGAADASDED